MNCDQKRVAKTAYYKELAELDKKLEDIKLAKSTATSDEWKRLDRLEGSAVVKRSAVLNNIKRVSV